MTDDEIRTGPLNGRGAPAPFSVSGAVGVLRDRVQGDVDEVDRWVGEYGGRIEVVAGKESQSLGRGRWQRPPSAPSSQWYVVPAAALGIE
jgi:hypothetical protein